MVVAIGGVSCKVEGTGVVRIIFKNSGESEIVNLFNLWHSRKLKRNLMSSSFIDKADSLFICKNGQITVYASGFQRGQ